MYLQQRGQLHSSADDPDAAAVGGSPAGAEPWTRALEVRVAADRHNSALRVAKLNFGRPFMLQTLVKLHL